MSLVSLVGFSGIRCSQAIAQKKAFSCLETLQNKTGGREGQSLILAFHFSHEKHVEESVVPPRFFFPPFPEEQACYKVPKHCLVLSFYKGTLVPLEHCYLLWLVKGETGLVILNVYM